MPARRNLVDFIEDSVRVVSWVRPDYTIGADACRSRPAPEKRRWTRFLNLASKMVSDTIFRRRGRGAAIMRRRITKGPSNARRPRHHPRPHFVERRLRDVAARPRRGPPEPAAHPASPRAPR